MLTWSIVQPLLAEGMTSEQVAAALAADPRHKRDVKATGADFNAGEIDLLHVLAAKCYVLRLNSKAEWVGPLVDYFNQDINDPTFLQLQMGFELLLTQLQVSNRTVFCYSDPATGALVTGLTAIAGSLSPIGPEATQALVDQLTGGLLYAGVTAADVDQAVADEEARLEAQRLYEEALAAEAEERRIAQEEADAARAAEEALLAEERAFQEAQLRWITQWNELYNKHIVPLRNEANFVGMENALSALLEEWEVE